MQADQRFAAWLAARRETDKFGHVYQYHPRSDAHSKALCEFIVDDLLDACPALRERARRGEVGYGINLRHRWSSGKVKTIDLALGVPKGPAVLPAAAHPIAEVVEMSEVLLSCEAKTVMTEHSKSQPRIFDELSSSHEIVHHGREDAIAAGVTVVNIAGQFVSPTRNQSSGPLEITKHRQPAVAARMVQHLRELAIRNRVGEDGFDAYCTFIVDCDNMGHAALWTGLPAPHVGDPDHYATFLRRIASLLAERLSTRR
jgi:hypothetical protein